MLCPVYHPVFTREEEERSAELLAALEQRREALAAECVEGPVNELYQEELRQRMAELAALAPLSLVHLLSVQPRAICAMYSLCQEKQIREVPVAG